MKFTIGDVLKIFFVVFLKTTKKRKKKMYFFVGLCTDKKKNWFKLKNTIKKEKIVVSFDVKSPLIYKLIVLKIYFKLIFRVSKIYFNIKNKYKDDFYNIENTIISLHDSFKKNYLFSGLFKRELFKKRKKIRKFRRKYFNTETWGDLEEQLDDLEDEDSD